MPKVHKNATEEIEQYIEKLPPFSKEICTRLRQIILNAVPGIIEDWKWGPNYNSDGMVCGFGAFQKHVKFTFFNGSAMKDPKGLFNHCVDNEFSRSIKYVSADEIDEQSLTAYLKESAAINKKGFKKVVKDKTIIVPEDLQHKLNESSAAKSFFEAQPYGQKKEFVGWIEQAKKPETRQARIEKRLKCVLTM